jgi:Flp pilus assembly protein TadG
MRGVRLRRRERGQAVVEFALVGIVFVILALGTIDVGRAVWNYNTLAEATREGTRYAIVHGSLSSDPSGPTPNDPNVTAKVQQFGSGLYPSRLTVLSEWIDGSNQAGKKVKVTSSYQFTPFFHFVGSLTFTMTSSSTMTITN